MKNIFSRIYYSINLFRFNVFLDPHLRATKNKLYKWWHERRIATPVHYLILLGYLLGVFSGIYSAFTPATSEAAYTVPQRTIYTNTGQDIYSYNLTSNTESSVTTSVYGQSEPAVYGDVVVWQDDRNSATTGNDIYMKNLVTGVESSVTTSMGNQTAPAIYGDIVVWQDDRNIATTGSDIYMKRLSTGTESAVTTAAGNQYSPAIYGDIVVWTDDRNIATGYDIYMKNLTTGVESAVTTAINDQTAPAIYGDIVVWQDLRNYSVGGGLDIYMKNLTTGVESAVTTAAGNQTVPAIYGNIVVWQDDRNSATTSTDIYMKNLTTGVESAVTTATGAQSAPVIYGNIVVWQDERNYSATNSDIYMKNISTGIESVVTAAGKNQYTPAIYGNRIVWADYRNDSMAATPRIYGNRSVFSDSIGFGPYVIDNLTGQKTLLAMTGNRPAVYGDIVVWEDARNTNTTGLDIYMKNMATGIESAVTTAASDQYAPVTNGNIVVWADDRNLATTATDIYMKNLSTGVVSAVTTATGNQTAPAIYGNIVVWQDDRNSATTGNDIYMKNLTTGVESAVTTATGNQTAPAIYGNIVVWQDDRNSATTGSDIYMKNLATGVESSVTTSTGNQTAPAIYGDIVVWQDDRNSGATGSDIYMKNLSSGVELAVSTATGNQNNPAIYGNEIVWEDNRNGYNQLFLASLDTTPPVFENLPNTNQKINLTDGQAVRTSPLTIKTKPVDVDSGILKVEYSVDTQLLATANTAGSDGVYAADISLAGIQNKSGGLVIKARAYDNTGNVSDYSLNIVPDPWFFIIPSVGHPIDIFAPEQLSVAPTNGTTGDILGINVTAWDNDAPSRAEISIDGSAFVNLPKTGGAASPDGIGHTGIFAGSVIMPSKTTASFVLKVYDAAGNVGTKTGAFTIIDNDAPVISDISPLEGFTGTNLTLIIKASDNIGVTKLQISIDGSAYSTVAGTEYSLKLPFDSIVPIKVKAKAFDEAGNNAESREFEIRVIDNIPPQIVSFTAPVELTKEKNIISVEATDNIAPVRAAISFDGVVWEDMVGTASPFSYAVAGSEFQTGKVLDYYIRVYDAAGNFGTTEKATTKLVPTPISAPNIFKRVVNGIVNLLNPKNTETKVLGAFQVVGDNFVEIIKKTPPPVAYSFPYILFILLAISALVFFYQAQSEARMSAKLLEILNFEKVIYEDKENFLILSSHYLRTPATIIVNGADLLATKNKEVKEKLLPLAERLAKEIQGVLKSIDKGDYLAHIKKPEIKKQKVSLLLSPFLLVPAVLVPLVAIVANALFINVAKINISAINLIAELIAFIITVQLFVSFGRRKYTQKRNREEFEQTISYERSIDKARNRFIDNVSEKITPYISELEKYTPKNTDKITTTIKEGKRRLGDILYKFSLLSQSTKGGFRIFKPQPISLKTQTKVALSVNATEIKNKNVKVKESLEAPEFKTDPTKVNFIISSLISNAIKFTKPNSKVKIESKKSGRKIEIIVSDEGPGISEEGKLHLFKPFTRTTSALNFDYEGFGLSLYLSKILVNSLGGDISLESKVGKGTTFRVVI